MGNKKKTTPAVYKVIITNNALENIDAITGYIAFINQQPLSAIKIGDAIFATIERIKTTPYAFKECEEIPTKTKMYRKAICHSWHIVYKIVDTNIIILGIIYASRKPSAIKKIRKVK
jgi:plasmid stabilization system protein ParE